MPQFYLHIRSGAEFIEDDEGMDLVDLAAAVNEALKGARSLMSAEVLQGALNLDQAIEIHVGEDQSVSGQEDESAAGNRWHVATITFAEALGLAAHEDLQAAGKDA